MAKSLERIQACALRKEGQSIKGIAKALQVSNSSVSAWTRDIILADEQRTFLKDRQIRSGNRGRMLGAESNRQKRILRLISAKEDAEKEISALSKKDLFYLGLGLYWGEGSKSMNSSLSVANSDPRVLILMKRWLADCFDVEDYRFAPRVFISDLHTDREEAITAFWSDTLSLPKSQFRKMVFLDKGKKIYENHEVYYGVLALGVSKGGDIRNRILAQIGRASELANTPV